MKFSDDFKFLVTILLLVVIAFGMFVSYRTTQSELVQLLETPTITQVQTVATPSATMAPTATPSAAIKKVVTPVRTVTP